VSDVIFPVVLRVDASPLIGLGHAMRCLALAEALGRTGLPVRLVTSAMPDAVAARFARAGATIVRIAESTGSAADSEVTIAEARRIGARWVVVDSYAVHASWQHRVRAAGLRLLVLDDEGCAGEWDADAILNQNLGANEAPYRLGAPQAALLVGPRFALLRGEFARQGHEPREIPDVAMRVLVTLGGADPGNATQRVVLALAQCHDVEVRVLAGASNPHRAMLAAMIAEAGSPTRTMQLIVQADDMPEQMGWADLAISAGGSTLWELARMQLPALLVTLADHQQALANACVSAGMARLLGDVHRTEVQVIAERINTLRSDAPARRSMARAGAHLVDGHGADRVVAHLRRCA
jgi:UDP-2,4-diacetamido-2,4,6-trideoxy-beta-L-altropyranose hydrolase